MKFQKRIQSIELPSSIISTYKSKVDKILQDVGTKYVWGENKYDKNYVYLLNTTDRQSVDIFRELRKNKMPMCLWVYYTPTEKDRIERAKKYVNENLFVNELEDGSFEINYDIRHIQDKKTKEELDRVIDLSKKEDSLFKENLSTERWVMLLHLSQTITTYLEYLKNILTILEYERLEMKEYILG